MALMWTLIYIIVAILVIWWVLRQAKKWGDAHGGGEHGQEQHHEGGHKHS